MFNNDIKIEDLIPTNSSFKLAKFDDFEFELEPCTSGKLIDIIRQMGDIEKILGNPSVDNLSKLALILMDFDSATKFRKQEVNTIDILTGEESTLEIGGYSLLMHSIAGLNEQYGIYSAILQSMGHNKKYVEKLIAELKSGINGEVKKELKKNSEKKKI